MIPSIGRIVHYRLTESEVLDITRRRDHGRGSRSASKTKSGAMVHTGNPVVAGELVPLIITKAGPETLVNGQVTLDGNDSLWVTCASEGHNHGEWEWPERV